MPVTALGYFGVGVKDIAAWRRFVTQVIGAQADDDGHEGLRVRIDERACRIALHPTGEDDILYAGWEVAGPAALEELAAKVEAAGAEVSRDDGRLAMDRGVMGIVHFTDPTGLRCELFWGAGEVTDAPLVSPVGVRGFVTGDQGLGHIVIGAAPEMLEANLAFYRDILGFGHSDTIMMPAGPQMRIPVQFMHCNQRHHSYAFAPVPPGRPKLLHFMLQVAELDDVGFALDRAAKAGADLALTLGRHSNDEMLSFYVRAPSGFEVEYGWGGRTVDPATWTRVHHQTTSKWGHKPVGRDARPA